MLYKNKDELIAKARDLRNSGLTYTKIANEIGVGSGSTIQYWLGDEQKKERIRGQKAKYKEENREKIREYSRIYEAEHKEEKAARGLVYRENNAEKEIERRRVYRETHREEIRLSNRIYGEKNKDRIRESKRLYREENKDKTQAYHKEYLKTHREERNEATRARRYRLENGTKILKDQYRAIWEEQDGLCFYCGKPMLSGVENQYSPDCGQVDHVNPTNNGGFHSIDNIVYACAGCNQPKSDKLVEVWMPEIMDKIYSNKRLNYSIEEAQMRWLV